MKNLTLPLMIVLCGAFACNKPTSPANSAAPSGSPMSSPPASSSSFADAVTQKLREYAGSGASNCGLFGVQSTADQLKAGSECATQANQGKKAFFVAYDMPGMSVGVAGDGAGKLFTVQAQGGGALASGACPSQLRVASSGRVTCFAPGDMGSMSGSHTAGSMPAGTPNPHSSGMENPHGASKTK